MDEITEKLKVAIQKWLVIEGNKSRWDAYQIVQNNLAETLNYFRVNRPEIFIPLRLACSVYLTQGTNNLFVTIPTTKEHFKNAWLKICKNIGETKEEHKLKFQTWLNENGNHRFAERFSLYFSEYIDTENPENDIAKLNNCKDKEEIKKFWMSFKGIGIQYAKNVPMDEKDSFFVNSIKIDARLNAILKDTVAANITDELKEQLFLNAAKKLEITGWEIDRLCYKFGTEIKQLM
jgi:hypothetical protein